MRQRKNYEVKMITFVCHANLLVLIRTARRVLLSSYFHYKFYSYLVVCDNGVVLQPIGDYQK